MTIYLESPNGGFLASYLTGKAGETHLMIIPLRPKSQQNLFSDLGKEIVELRCGVCRKILSLSITWQLTWLSLITRRTGNVVSNQHLVLIEPFLIETVRGTRATAIHSYSSSR